MGKQVESSVLRGGQAENTADDDRLRPVHDRDAGGRPGCVQSAEPREPEHHLYIYERPDDGDLVCRRAETGRENSKWNETAGQADAPEEGYDRRSAVQPDVRAEYPDGM